MRTAVVILNYNGKSYLAQFLPLVIQHTTSAEIVVADNCSTDGSVEMLQHRFPAVRVIQLDRNEGFSRGYNLALQQVEAQYYVLLNSDVEVTPGWLEPLIALMEGNPRIAACQPKIRSFSRKHLFEYAGAAGGFLDQWGYPFCRGRLFDTVEEDLGQYDNTVETDWATGACMVVRADTYWKAGGLDDHFFAHMEEIDLCWRLRSMGHKIFYNGQSTVFHVGGGTLNRISPRKTFLNFRNGLALLYKNLPDDRLWTIVFLRLVLDGVAGLFFLLRGFPAHCWAVVKAHASFYVNFRLWAQQRKNARRIGGGFSRKPFYQDSIIKAYFLQGKKKFSELPAQKFHTVG